MKVIADLCGFRKIFDVHSPGTNPPQYIMVRALPKLDRLAPSYARPDPEKLMAHDLQLKLMGYEDKIPVYTITLEEVLEQCLKLFRR